MKGKQENYEHKIGQKKTPVRIYKHSKANSPLQTFKAGVQCVTLDFWIRPLPVMLLHVTILGYSDLIGLGWSTMQNYTKSGP